MWSSGMKAQGDRMGNRDAWISSAFFYALCLVCITLPLNARLNSLTVILLVLCWIAEGAFRDKIQRLLRNPQILLFAAFYLCFVIGMIYTENVGVGQFNLEKKLSLLALPILIGTSRSYSLQARDRVLWCFAFSSISAALICLGGAIYHFTESNDTSHFFHDKLASTIDLQPPYFGMFLAMTIAIIMDYWRRWKDKQSTVKSASLFALALLITCFIVLLSARTSFVFLLLFGTFMLLVTNSRRQRVAGLITIGVAVGLAAIFIANSAYLQDRFIKPMLADISVTSGGQETGLSIRLVKWKCSLEGIMEHPVLGVGTGDAGDYLVKCYEREQFWGMYEQYQFNSHNQYLETGLTLGLVGLLLLISLLIWPLIISIRRKDFLCISFLALLSVCFLTESVLERQWGIVFFTLFVSLFLFVPQVESSKQP